MTPDNETTIELLRAIQLLRDNLRAVLGDTIERGHSPYCKAAESDNPVSAFCDCGQATVVSDALDALRKTTARGVHHHSMLRMDGVCVKCGADYHTATNFCPSDEGLA